MSINETTIETVKLFIWTKEERTSYIGGGGGNSKQKFSVLMFYCELKKCVVNYYFEDIRYQITSRFRALEIRVYHPGCY